MPDNDQPAGKKDETETGREKKQPAEEQGRTAHPDITNLPLKDNKAHNETEGERRFKEGIANNSDTDPK